MEIVMKKKSHSISSEQVKYPLQGSFLNQMLSEKRLVRVYLINGIQLQGYIKGFNPTAIFLATWVNSEACLVTQIIYKQAIAVIKMIPI